MGQKDIKTPDAAGGELRHFVRALLEDVRALERMIEEGRIESGVRRIGAEQEMFIVDASLRPAPKAIEILKRLEGGPFTYELASFNLEANLSPQPLSGNCLSAMEAELIDAVAQARAAAMAEGTDVLLTGILPTLQQKDLTLANMVPFPRYHALNQVMSELRGGKFQTYIKGLDELSVSHDNVMMEACNTSFQVHFQVGAEEFANLYNLAQAVTGPVLAAAVNSPALLQHRLWHETRVALFQQSLDVRSETLVQRGTRPRVTFGDRWIENSVLEIFREDIARFRALLSTDLGESSMAMLDRGETPPLKALCLHNGTVYRWNRPCYGVKDGQAHLRIENRVMPAGPTIADEIANAAFFFGLMVGLDRSYGDVRDVMSFDDAKNNFIAAARYGLNAQFRWVKGKTSTARDLMLQHLIPLSRDGLREKSIDQVDIDRFLGLIEERVQSERTGAQWALDSLNGMPHEATRYERHHALTRAIASNQRGGEPVHTWPLAQLESASPEDWRDSFATVEQIMTSDVFTVGPEDVIDLAASLMDWEHLRRVPVEDSDGRLVGLLTQRGLLRLGQRANKTGADVPVAVRDVMRPNPVTIAPDASTLEAFETMRRHKVGCLPVVKDERLVGIVTEHDFMEVAGMLLEEKLREAR